MKKTRHTTMLGLALGIIIVSVVSAGFSVTVASATQTGWILDQYTAARNILGIPMCELWSSLYWTVEGIVITSAWFAGPTAAAAWYAGWFVTGTRVDYGPTIYHTSPPLEIEYWAVGQVSADYVRYLIPLPIQIGSAHLMHGAAVYADGSYSAWSS